MLGALLEAAVTEDLQIHQAQADSKTPENENSGKYVEAKMGAIADCAGGSHRFSLRKIWRPVSRQAQNIQLEIVISSATAT
jgi:hypothetical protein